MGRTLTIRGLRQSFGGKNLVKFVVAAIVVALVGSLGFWWLERAQTGTKLTAYFGETLGIYPGSEVRILGVKVGVVDAVQPQGAQVKVSMSVDPGVKVPADVHAVSVTPSVVSDRYVQLTPVYTGGPMLVSGAVLQRDHTATPVELDELYDAGNKLATALGPNGANKNGALSDLLNAGAANLDGNGQNLHDTLVNLSQAANALSDSRGDMFSTVDNLQKFTRTLATSDAQLQEFDTRLQDASGYLAGERQDLGAAMSQLAIALDQVNSFIRENRAPLKSNVDNLAAVTKVVVDERAALAESLDVNPLLVNNAINTYNAASNTNDTRSNISELTNPPALLICKLIKQNAPSQMPPSLADLCGQLQPIIDGTVPLPTTAEVVSDLRQGKLPPLPLPLLNAERAQPQQSGPQGGGR